MKTKASVHVQEDDSPDNPEKTSVPRVIQAQSAHDSKAIHKLLKRIHKASPKKLFKEAAAKLEYLDILYAALLQRYSGYLDRYEVEWVCPDCFTQGVLFEEYENPEHLGGFDDPGEVVATFGLCTSCGVAEILSGVLPDESLAAFRDVFWPSGNTAKNMRRSAY